MFFIAYFFSYALLVVVFVANLFQLTKL